jgi:hypothetical protein
MSKNREYDRKQKKKIYLRVKREDHRERPVARGEMKKNNS